MASKYRRYFPFGEDEVGDWFACASCHLALLELLRKVIWVAEVADGPAGADLEVGGDIEVSARLFVVELPANRGLSEDELSSKKAV
jgi:hypothetical protein